MSNPSPIITFLKRRIGLWIFVAFMLILLVARTLVFASRSQGQPVTAIAPTDLHRDGKLALAQAGDGVAMLDLSTGVQTRPFKPPANSLVTGVALSPDGKTVVMAYAPPPENSPIQFGYTDLYAILAEGGSTPTLLVDAPDGEIVYQPAFSSDGSYLYFARVATRAGMSILTLERIAYADGKVADGAPEIIAEDASGPSPFPDSTRLAFIHRDPQDYTESLYAIDTAGGSPAPLLDPKAFTSIDAVRVAPDGQQVIFSAASPSAVTTAPPDPLSEAVFGKLARAHGIPADLWLLTFDGSRPVRQTHLEATGLIPSFGRRPDEVYFVANGSLYRIDIRVRQLFQIQIVGQSYAVSWGP